MVIAESYQINNNFWGRRFGIEYAFSTIDQGTNGNLPIRISDESPIIMTVLRQESVSKKLKSVFKSIVDFTNPFPTLPAPPTPITIEEIMGIYNQKPHSSVKRITRPDIPESFIRGYQAVVFFPIDIMANLYNQVVDTFVKRVKNLTLADMPSWFYSIPAIPAITAEQIMAVLNNVKPFIAKSRIYNKIPESFTMGYQAVVFFPIDIAMSIYNQVVDTWRKRTTWFNVPESYFAWINALPQAPTLTTEMIMTLYNNVIGFVSKKRFQNWTPESYTTWINSIPVFPITQIMAMYNQVVPKFVKRVVNFNVPESYNVWKNVIIVSISLVIKTLNLYIGRKQHDLVVPKKSHNLFIPLKLHTAVISGKLHKVLISIKNHRFLS